MKETNCPICFEPLEVRLVAPCEECGGLPEEITHYEEGLHTYAEYEVFEGLNLILCNFCDVDFASFDTSIFGLSKGARVDISTMKLVRQVESPKISKDKFCVKCGLRLAFLRFLAAAKKQNAC